MSGILYQQFDFYLSKKFNCRKIQSKIQSPSEFYNSLFVIFSYKSKLEMLFS